MDTPGIGDETVLGQKRMKRTDEVISKTDIGVLVVSDTQTGPEREMLKKFKDTSILLVINKIDLLSEEEIKKIREDFFSYKIVEVSALKKLALISF